MFENFTSFDIITQSDPSVSVHGIRGGSGPPLLLLHGFPQTHHIWHRVTPQLVQDFTIVALDIRGYGASSKPSGIAQYSKTVMARDCSVVMENFGFTSFFVGAHDRGARVAHKLLVNYPDRVRKAIFLDICPTLAMYSKTDFEFATAYFHWFFLIQEAPLPETMIGLDPRKWAELFMGGRHAGLAPFDAGVFEEYVRVLEDTDAVHAMCEDYRASASVDMDEAKDDLEEGRLIHCPLRVLWGRHGVIERCFDAVREWKDVAAPDVNVDGASVDCGHYIPEEAPDVVSQNIKLFFR
ncbi:Fluoroacetate dehalogenase [Hyphodiscus hymeniophilus]|uniref:Fluoroacetate dehalogenase n=1 Tax=Hyphodiscus hymeniophilus TaxID=353542 RepID=A0A9P7AZH1_9HELO|nr:Fluoroacetate dehalogenase [Hyphodiscus hymeniophilus]